MEEKKTNIKKKTQTKKYYPPKKKTVKATEEKKTKKVVNEEPKTEVKKETETKKEIRKEKPDFCKLFILIFIAAVALGVMIFVVYKNIFNKNDVSNKVTINNKTTLINIDEGEKVDYVLELPNDNIGDIIWSVDNDSIVKIVDNSIEGLASGKTSVKVSDGNSFEYVFEVKVNSFNGTNKIAAIDPTGIGLSNATLNLSIGKSFKVTAVVFPDNAIQKVLWNSDNNSIASVNNDGVVTGIAKGTTTIYATTSNGISIGCEVTIN